MKIRGAGKKSGGFGADEHNQKKARAYLCVRVIVIPFVHIVTQRHPGMPCSSLSFHQGAVISPCLAVAFFFFSF